ncbi:unnamed protein product [Amoebophrya sp. A25]|nr:unnamed protein product [Amoebophrya sp. A25]|eukprot:GSA25T00001630001.1
MASSSSSAPDHGRKMRQAPAASADFFGENKPEEEEEKEDVPLTGSKKAEQMKPDVEMILVAGELIPVSKEHKVQDEDDNAVVINRVHNYHGSTAAAGSDFFHMYQKTRGRELERLEKLDADHDAKLETLAFQQKRINNFHKDQEKLEKNRAKRQKKKERQRINKAKRKKGDKDESSDEEVDEEQNVKFRRIASTVAANDEEQEPDEPGANHPSTTSRGAPRQVGRTAGSATSGLGKTTLPAGSPNQTSSGAGALGGVLDFADLAAQVQKSNDYGGRPTSETTLSLATSTTDDADGAKQPEVKRMQQQNLILREDFDI